MRVNDYVVRVKRYEEATDSRLGRHVRHDSRSLNYLFPEADTATLVSKRHVSAIPVLDQGQLGSCTGNAATKVLSYAPLWTEAVQAVLSTTDAIADEAYAVGVYSDATKLDPWAGEYPPTDTGSDGLSVAKVAKNRGLIDSYLHATTFTAVLNALQSQAVIVGTEWRNDMFTPEPDGRLRITGGVAGGHEYVLDEIDVENHRVWVQNSWGEEWGINGRAYLTWDDLETLLAADGDCTIFVAPVPVPPEPEPVPVPESDADQTLVAAVSKWLRRQKWCPKNEAVRQALLKWKSDKQL